MDREKVLTHVMTPDLTSAAGAKSVCLTVTEQTRMETEEKSMEDKAPSLNNKPYKSKMSFLRICICTLQRMTMVRSHVLTCEDAIHWIIKAVRFSQSIAMDKFPIFLCSQIQ